MPLPRLVVAALQSGTGKTTVATGLMAALTRRGVKVQPYKVGPDYIDPTYHAVATGRISRNLDGWMCPPETIAALVARSSEGAEIALIEGVMGLFDGAAATSEAGSTAQMAKWLGAPVLLVVDARGMARSVGALLQGLTGFDPDLRLAGVVFNNVGSESHYKLLCEAVGQYAPGVEPLGWLPKQAAIRAPERHLGLVPSYEQPQVAAYLESLTALIDQQIDLEAVLALARRTALPLPAPPDRPAAAGERVRIGIARDEAFHFYYEDGLDLLRDLGAELIPFSPLRDAALPPDLDGLYMGGGFPEVYRRELSGNEPMRSAILQAIDQGMPVYAECGGLMFLTEAIVDTEGESWPMVGAIPVRASMQNRLASLGYATAAVQGETLLGAPGETLRGHEFHWSVIEERPQDWPAAYQVTTRRGGTRPEGFCRGNLLASYVHLHFAANPAAAQRLIENLRRYRRAKKEAGVR